jgi:hypothetical protein
MCLSSGSTSNRRSALGSLVAIHKRREKRDRARARREGKAKHHVSIGRNGRIMGKR